MLTLYKLHEIFNIHRLWYRCILVFRTLLNDANLEILR
jgi:hypothetical protein